MAEGRAGTGAIVDGDVAIANTVGGHLWQVDPDTLETIGAGFTGVNGAWTTWPSSRRGPSSAA